MWINRIAYGTENQGINAGQLGYHVEFNSNRAEGSKEVTQLIHRIEDHKGKSKKIFLTGKYSPDGADMFCLCKPLHDRHYTISATIDGQTPYYWLRYINWIIVELTTSLWSGFYCNELRYHVSSATDPEPLIPLPPRIQNALSTFLYLIPSKEMKFEEILSFGEKSSNNWAILSPTKKSYSKVIWKGGANERE